MTYAEKLLLLEPFWQNYFRKKIEMLRMINHPIDNIFFEDMYDKELNILCYDNARYIYVNRLFIIPSFIYNFYGMPITRTLYNYTNNDIDIKAYPIDLFKALYYNTPDINTDEIILSGLTSLQEFTEDDINYLINKYVHDFGVLNYIKPQFFLKPSPRIVT